MLTTPSEDVAGDTGREMQSWFMFAVLGRLWHLRKAILCHEQADNIPTMLSDTH